MLTLLMSDPPAGQSGVENAMAHALDHAHFEIFPGVTFSNFKFMLFLGAVVILLIGLTMDRVTSVPRGLFRNGFESLLLFVRGIAREAHLPDSYVPFLCTTFTFILTLNLLGMVPIPKFGGTATSNLMVTGALASIVFVVSVLSGIIHHGWAFPKLFVPAGLPFPLIPVLFVLEIAGFLIKHAVLMVRLFANMIAGHLVIGAFLGLIPDMHSYWVAGLLSVPLALFVSVLELLVAFLQAYVFTLLSSLFIGGMVHPEH